MLFHGIKNRDKGMNQVKNQLETMYFGNFTIVEIMPSFIPGSKTWDKLSINIDLV